MMCQVQQTNSNPLNKKHSIMMDENTVSSSKLPRKRVRFSLDAEHTPASLAQTDSCTNPTLVVVDQVPPQAPMSLPPPPPPPSRRVIHHTTNQQRRPARRSKSPPTVLPQVEDESSSTANSETSKSTTATATATAALEHQLQRLERAIQDSALAELKLMNRAKHLRSRRAALQHKYERLAGVMREQHGQAAFSGATSLPPLM